MICPSCNKFPAYDTSSEPEVELEVDQFEYAEGEKPEGAEPDADVPPSKDAGTAYVTGTARIVLTSECCGDELKEATFEVQDVQIDVERGEGCTCDISELDVTSSQEITDHSETEKVTIAKRGPNKGQEVRKPIPFRYQKRFYGCEITIEVSCSCGKTSAEATWSDDIQASAMDELV